MKTKLSIMFAATVLASSPVAAEACAGLSLSDEALGALLAAPGAARPVLLELLQVQLQSTPPAKDSLVALLGTQLDRALLTREPSAFRTRLAEELAPLCQLAALVAAPIAPPGDESKADAQISDPTDSVESEMFESVTRGAKEGETTAELLDALRKAGRTAFARNSTKAVSRERRRGDLTERGGDESAQFADFEHQTFVHENLMRPEETRRICGDQAGSRTRREGVSVRCEAILNEVNTACPDLPESNSLRCSERLFRETSQRFAVIKAAHERAGEISADAPQTQELARLRTHAEPLFQRSASVEAHRVASYGLYAGPSFQLADDGGWKGGTEILFKQQTEIFQPRRLHCPGSFFSWCRGYFEASFTTPDEFPTEVQSDSGVPVETFDSKGRLRIEGGLLAHFNDWAGIEFGGGFASPLGDSSGFSRAEFRGKLGVHLQTLHNDGMLGQLSFGVLHDRSRVYLRGMDNPDTSVVELPVPAESFDRFYLDATALFPKIELGGWRLAARLSGDWPIDGNEQADVRVSALFYYPFNSWLETFRPKLQPANP